MKIAFLGKGRKDMMTGNRNRSRSKFENDKQNVENDDYYRERNIKLLNTLKKVDERTTGKKKEFKKN